MRIVVTGATGLIGRHLSRSLTAEGHSVVALCRNPAAAGELAAAQLFTWDSVSGPPPREALEGVDAVVHLAGEPIAARRWSDEQKKRIRDSRVIGTRNLVEGLRSLDKQPAVLVSGSAVGFYGSRGDEQLDEAASPGNDFLAEVCQQWEQEAKRASELELRMVLLRTGVVLSTDGGALKKMLPAFRMGVAGPLGDGKQWFPWIHIDDVAGIIGLAISSRSLEGAVNAASPGAVTNAGFTRELGRVLHRPAVLPAPAFALRLVLGEMAEMLISSQRVVPRAALDAGYSFRYTELATALENLFGESAKKATAR